MARRKRDSRLMERHHRLPRSRGGTDTYPENNVILVQQNMHRAWHLLVGNMEAPEIADMLNDNWIDPSYYLVAIPRKRKKYAKRRQKRYCTDCECEVLKHLKSTNKEEK